MRHQVPLLRTFYNGIDGRLKARLSSLRCWRFVCSFVVRKLDRSQRRNWGGRDEGNKRGSKKCNPWERGCWKVSSIIVPQILNWAIALRKYSMLYVEWVKVVAKWIVSLLKLFRCELDSAVLNEFAWNTQGVGYFLIEANGDVPLDGVAFSRLVWL